MAKSDQIEELRTLCETDIWSFARYVLPLYEFGDLHRDILRGMSDPHRAEETPNRLYLVSRDHLKSVMLATYACWLIARDPATTILYMTADSPLGVLQMGFCQMIFESEEWKALWPDHFRPEAGRRDKWTSQAINCDHPLRTLKKVRDETLVVRTIGSGNTGRHPSHVLFDDIVVPANAYTEIGRADVRAACAQASSLAKGNTLMTAVGTTYHVNDQYALWEAAEYDKYNDDGEYEGRVPMWKVTKKAVESAGDGTGTYIWPRTFSPKLHQWFGWGPAELAKKKGDYYASGERVQFAAQYYLNPNPEGEGALSADSIQYLNPNMVVQDRETGRFTYNGKPLTLGAFLDVAATDAASPTAMRADFTALCVMAVDADGFYYVLSLTQFQTDKRQKYAEEVVRLYNHWGFKRLYVESDGVGKIVGEGLKESIRELGLNLIVEGSPAPKGMSKIERHASIAYPKFQQGSVYLTKGGYTDLLIEQLVLERPPHDDLLDSVTMGFQHLKPPAVSMLQGWAIRDQSNVILANNRFGGRR